MQQKEIKELLENNNFRNNQNYVINEKSIDKYIKFLKSYKFNKLEDSYFWELLVWKFKKYRVKKIKKDLIIIFFLLVIIFYLPILLIWFSIYFWYLILFYFWKDINFHNFIIVKDNKRILFSQMWYYKSKIKLGITKIYYKHY